MIIRIIISILIGLIGSICYFQEDAQVKAWVERAFCDSFAQGMNCAVRCRVKRLNIFVPSLELEDLQVHDAQGDNWHWHAQSYYASCTWWHLITKKEIDLRVRMEQVHSFSRYTEGKLAIGPHVQALIAGPPDIRMFIKEVILKDAHFSGTTDTGEQWQVSWRNNAKRIGDKLYAQIHIAQARCAHQNNTPLLDEFSGTIAACIDFTKPTAPDITAHINSRCCLPSSLSSSTIVYLNGSWDHDRGTVQLSSSDDRMQAPHISFHYDQNNMHILGSIQFPLQALTAAYTDNLHGQISVQGDFSLSEDYTVNGSIAAQVEQLSYNHAELPLSCTTQATLTAQSVTGTLTTHNDSGQSIDIDYCYDIPTAHWHANLGAAAPFTLSSSLGSLIINAQTQAHIDAADDITASFTVDASCGGQPIVSNGSATYHADNVIESSGTVQNGTYSMHQNDTDRSITFQFTDQTNHTLQATYDPGSHKITGALDLTLLKKPLLLFAGIPLEGHGVLKLEGTLENNQLHNHIYLENGAIRLGSLFNFINSLDMRSTYDFDKQKICIESLNCGLHRGTITAHHATAYLNEQGVQQAYLPLSCNQCLMSLEKDLFSIISGNIIMNYSPEQGIAITAHGVLEHTQVNENILSSSFVKELSSATGAGHDSNSSLPPITYQIELETKDPIRITTRFLQADATAHITLSNHHNHSTAYGTVQIPHGTIQFPYKPLFINRAQLTFLADDPYNPLIDLRAQNTIKNYLIRLHATGLLAAPDITLSSSPMLTEEQIISLLLAGSEHESLAMVMPLVAMNTIKKLLFDSEQSPFKQNEYWQFFSRPLRHVNLVPSVTDQTARGGIRGGVEVEIGDRMRALIQKNFSLPEDTRFEIEYTLSDEVRLRGIRNERRDVTGECEVKWKF